MGERMNGNGAPRVLTPQQVAANERFMHHREIAVNAIKAGCSDAVCVLACRETGALTIVCTGKHAPSVLSEAITQHGLLARTVLTALEMPFEMERQRRVAAKEANEGKKDAGQP